MTLQLFDRLPLENVRETDDGYLVATVKAARTGIQEYAGFEVDPDNKHGLRDKAIVRVQRDASEVMAPATLRSFAHRPVTNDHPRELVNSKNWKGIAVGQTGGEIDASDGKFVQVPMCLMDGEAIADYQSGKKQLSMGYTTALDFTPGVNDDGEAYDARQTDMRMNHLAVVHRARGGNELKIGDHQQGAPTVELKTITLDGLPVTTTDAGIAAIEKLKGMLKDAADGHNTLIAARDATITDLTTKLAKADSDLEAATKAVPDAAALDSLATARGDLIANAKAILPTIDTAGKSDADIRKEVVTAKIGDAAKGKDQTYLDARFDILIEEAKANGGLERALSDTATVTVVGDAAATEAAHAASVANINAWRKTA